MIAARGVGALLLALAIVIAGCGAPEEDAPAAQSTAEQPPDSIRQQVERRIEMLNQMRESLAATIDTPTVDKSTFKRVCAPVGMRARELAAENGWTVQQLAEKYRNPAHALDAEAQEFHDTFAAADDTTEVWVRTRRNETEGWRYARRITVQPTCLHCHGPKEQRPDFVKQGYPEDRAYGFEAGDLRGLYTVFVPDSTATP